MKAREKVRNKVAKNLNMGRVKKSGRRKIQRKGNQKPRRSTKRHIIGALLTRPEQSIDQTNENSKLSKPSPIISPTHSVPTPNLRQAL